MKPPPPPNNNNAVHGHFGGRMKQHDNWFSMGLMFALL
jgi:hypothetical protein